MAKASGLFHAEGQVRWVLFVPRHRYRQDPLPLGDVAPAAELFGPEQPSLPGLELMQQGQLQVLPLGPLFESNQDGAKLDDGDG